MPTLFTRILDGELPGHFVWRDERCGVFLSINPIARGHALVVPLDEVDHWLDLEPDLTSHLARVAQAVGRAQMQAFSPRKVGLIVAGLEVPHVHVHVLPIETERDISFANAAPSVPGPDLEAAAIAIREALRDLGYEQAAE